MIDRGKHNLLGVNISAVDYESAIKKIIESAEGRRALGVSALAVHGVMCGVMDATHRHRLNQLELIVPDGQPVRWGLNLLHRTALSERVYGPDLMLKTCEAAAERGIGLFLFGGKQRLLDDLKQNLLRKYPGLKISGVMPSRFRKITPEEKQEIIRTISASGAAITMVGLGCPRQEVWSYEFKDSLQMPVLAVGAAFSFHAGHISQAPPWMQERGLEWLYRLSQEPTRLWHRYLVLNPYYVTLLFLQWSKLKTVDPTTTTPPEHEVLYG